MVIDGISREWQVDSGIYQVDQICRNKIKKYNTYFHSGPSLVLVKLVDQGLYFCNINIII